MCTASTSISVFSNRFKDRTIVTIKWLSWMITHQIKVLPNFMIIWISPLLNSKTESK